MQRANFSSFTSHTPLVGMPLPPPPELVLIHDMGSWNSTPLYSCWLSTRSSDENSSTAIPAIAIALHPNHSAHPSELWAPIERL